MWRALFRQFKFQRLEDTAPTTLYRNSFSIAPGASTRLHTRINFKLITSDRAALAGISRGGQLHRRRQGLFVKDAEAALVGLARELGVFEAEVSLVLCDASYSRYLNGRTRGVDRATDVLAFEYAPMNEEIFGDVVISLDATHAQASRFGHSFRDEYRILLIHGLLHLVGFDHEQGKHAAKEMREAEQALAQSLGWNPHRLLLTRSNTR